MTTTQPTAEQLEVARKCAAKAYRNADPTDALAGYIEIGEMDDDEAVQSALLAIQATEARMAAAVGAGYALAMSSGKLIVALDNMEVFKHHREAVLRDMKAFTDARRQAIRNQSNG